MSRIQTTVTQFVVGHVVLDFPQLSLLLGLGPLLDLPFLLELIPLE